VIVAGIDVGGKNVHIVIKKDGQILGKGTGPTGIKKAEALEQLYDEIFKKAGLKEERCGAKWWPREVRLKEWLLLVVSFLMCSRCPKCH